MLDICVHKKSQEPAGGHVEGKGTRSEVSRRATKQLGWRSRPVPSLFLYFLASGSRVLEPRVCTVTPSPVWIVMRAMIDC
jgi:hypothetical protein